MDGPLTYTNKTDKTATARFNLDYRGNHSNLRIDAGPGWINRLEQAGRARLFFPTQLIRRMIGAGLFRSSRAGTAIVVKIPYLVLKRSGKNRL